MKKNTLYKDNFVEGISRISWFIFQLIHTKIQAYKFLYIFQPPAKMFNGYTSRDIGFGMAFPIDSIGKDILSNPGKCHSMIRRSLPGDIKCLRKDFNSHQTYIQRSEQYMTAELY